MGRGGARLCHRGSPRLDFLELESRGDLLTEGVENLRPAHLSLGLDAQRLDVLAQNGQVAFARAEVGSQLGNGIHVLGQPETHRQDEGDHHEQEHPRGKPGRDDQAASALWADEPVLPCVGYVARMEEVDRETSAHSPRSASPNACRNCEPAGRGTSPTCAARTSMAWSGSMISKGAESPRRSASQRPMYGMSAQPASA